MSCLMGYGSTRGSRLVKVRGALLALTPRRRISGRQVEAVIRHATFSRLVRRETLSVFCTSYVFIRQVGETFVPVGLFLVSSWELPWNWHVLATDACETL